MSKMNVNLAGVELKNPVMTASGTFGSGTEYSEFVDLNKLGAVVTKGVANVPWPGNPTPRVTETASGMLNAIGLQNPGIDVFCERRPRLRLCRVPPDADAERSRKDRGLRSGGQGGDRLSGHLRYAERLF